jgi:hypothetical protein
VKEYVILYNGLVMPEVSARGWGSCGFLPSTKSTAYIVFGKILVAIPGVSWTRWGEKNDVRNSFNNVLFPCHSGGMIPWRKELPAGLSVEKVMAIQDRPTYRRGTVRLLWKDDWLYLSRCCSIAVLSIIVSHSLGPSGLSARARSIYPLRCPLEKYQRRIFVGHDGVDLCIFWESLLS